MAALYVSIFGIADLEEVDVAGARGGRLNRNVKPSGSRKLRSPISWM